MRYLYFLIFLAVLSISAGSLITFGQYFFDFYEKAVASNLQTKLLALQLTEAERLIKFSQEKPITLLFVGDIMLSRGVANQIKKHQDYLWPFLKISSTTQEADLTFGNLEGPISSGGKNQGSIYSFRADPKVAGGLKFAGFDVLSLANNHIFDYGREAFLDTISILKENGIEPIGAGENYLEANNPIIKEINKTKIAFLAYTNLYPKTLKAEENSPGISDFDVEKIKNGIKYLKESQTADIVVISFHWGEEYQTHSNLDQQNIASSLIEAGADLIVGHHPHAVQEFAAYEVGEPRSDKSEREQYRSGWVAYSLGNFIFDQNFSEETIRGLMLKIIVKNKEISEVLPIAIKINSAFQPEINKL